MLFFTAMMSAHCFLAVHDFYNGISDRLVSVMPPICVQQR